MEICVPFSVQRTPHYSPYLRYTVSECSAFFHEDINVYTTRKPIRIWSKCFEQEVIVPHKADKKGSSGSSVIENSHVTFCCLFF